MAHVRDLHKTRGTTTGKRWQVRYRTPEGDERAEHFRTHAEADDRKVAIEASLRSHTWVDPRLAKTPVESWLMDWQASRLGRRPSTRARDEVVIRRHLLPAFGKAPIGSVRPMDVKRLVADLHERGYAPAYIAKAYQLLAAAFNAAVEEGLLARSPCRGVELPKIERREMTILTPAEVSRLADTIRPRFRALVLTAAYTGLRAGELSGLHVDQLDLLRKRVRVTRTAVDVRGHWSVGEPKTNASRRTVSLPQALCEMIAQHLAEYGPSDDGLVFTAPQGGPIRWSSWRRRYWKPALEKAGLGHVRPHDLRHSHAAWLIAANEHPKVIQSRLGHASISTTLDTYGHLMDGLDEDAAERLNDVLAAAPEDLSRTETVVVPFSSQS